MVLSAIKYYKHMKIHPYTLWRCPHYRNKAFSTQISQELLQACDHDLGLHAKYIPCGMVDEDSAQLHLT